MKRFSYIFGISMAVIMVLTLILPALSPQQAVPTVAPATPTEVPPLPTPLPATALTFEGRYLHPSGLFTVAEPVGWLPSQPETTDQNARAVFVNNAAQSIIQVDVQDLVTDNDEGITLDQVDALFSQAWLAETWRSYSSWQESSRELDEDKLIIDFELSANNQQYVARQESWTDGDWVYSVRVVTPANATDMLLALLEGEVASLQPEKAFSGLPFSWNAYFDPTDTHIIRYPSTWSVEDAAPGQPASIGDAANTSLRVEAHAETVIDSEESASAWVESLRPSTEILSVQPVERADASGFAVAYSTRTVDGDSESGLAVLLNGEDQRLHTANLRFPAAAVDLNAADVDSQFIELASVMESFYVMSNLSGVDTDLAPAQG